MGARHSKRPQRPQRPKPTVKFDDFEVLRAIGRGAFGKVCLVERKDTKKVFAMKYVNKEACIKQNAVQNVVAEVELLRAVDHAFVVSLWYTFQDAEDLFIILEPLLGGDIRYHLNNGNGSESTFSEEAIRFICAEIATALDFLRTKAILHRDVKPDNILLDDAGHAHLTDFNVATYLKPPETLAKIMAGTKPYMAPEIYYTAASPSNNGYSYAADWWSLGITAYELKTGGRRPLEILPKASVSSVLDLFQKSRIQYPERWSPEFAKVVQGLLTFRPEKRLASLAALKKTKLMANVNFNSLNAKKLPPPFVPDNDGLNCDPTYELEEMIVETRPLHKKKKRLLRQQSLNSSQQSPNGKSINTSQQTSDAKFIGFPAYNREWERYQDSLREKEQAWEFELKRLMEASAMTATAIATNDTSVAAAGVANTPTTTKEEGLSS